MAWPKFWLASIQPEQLYPVAVVVRVQLLPQVLTSLGVARVIKGDRQPGARMAVRPVRMMAWRASFSGDEIASVQHGLVIRRHHAH